MTELKKNRKGRWDLPLFLMLLPMMALFLVVSVYPFLWVVKYVFYDYNGFVAYPVGLDNFKRIFTKKAIW